jgi:hypothetical protein
MNLLYHKEPIIAKKNKKEKYPTKVGYPYLLAK